MALGTWKEDPLENRELQETVNANVTTNVSAADLADIKKEEQLDAVLINQGVITQQTVDGLNADRVDLSDDVTGGNKSIISKKNQKLLDKKSKKLNPKCNKITKPAPPGILRYPYEGMTQHTDYLQIDMQEYVPVGRKGQATYRKEVGYTNANTGEVHIEREENPQQIESALGSHHL